MDNSKTPTTGDILSSAGYGPEDKVPYYVAAGMMVVYADSKCKNDKLEAFTMAAMEGICHRMEYSMGITKSEAKCVGETAICIAQATLAELSKHQ